MSRFLGSGNEAGDGGGDGLRSDPLCDRMEIGEERAAARRCGASQSTVFEDVKSRSERRANAREKNGDIPHFLSKRGQASIEDSRGLSPFAREAGKWGMSPFFSLKRDFH